MAPFSKSFSLFVGLLLMNYSGPLLEASGSHTKGELILTDFTSISSDLGWYVVNDNVMGGRSEGDFQLEQEKLSFAGRTNTKGGGFSSIRTKPLQLDLSTHTGIQLYVKGDGRRYTWRLTTDARWRGRQVGYWADFETQSGIWSTVNIPFSRFTPQVRGYQLEGPMLDREQITGMGLMIYDKQDGPFELHLASVHAYSEDVPFALIQHQWQNRILVLSAPTADDETLGELQLDMASTPEEFADRDLLLVTLLDDALSTAGARELTTAEAAMARASLGLRPGSFALRLVGKDGSVKLASETATSMAEIYSLIDGMPMRQTEKRDY